MAMRPIVLVYQDFATQSSTVALTDLNALMVGPCYDVLDFPTDKDSIYAGVVGSMTTVPGGTVSAGVPLTGVVPGLRAGAVMDRSSLQVYVDSALVEIAYGADGAVVVDQNTFTTAGAVNFTSLGVQVGDRLVVGDLDSGGTTVIVAKTVMAISTDGRTLTLTSNFAKAGTDIAGTAFSFATMAVSALSYRVERAVSGLTESVGAAALDANVAVPTLTVANLKVKINSVAKPVTYAKAYTAYRALRTDLGSDIDTVSSTSEILGKLGRIDARNPLAIAASVAFQNSNSKPVQFLGVVSDDITGYQTARDTIVGRKDIYAIVPLTQDVPTLLMWKNHCASLADPEVAKFRVVIGSGSLPTEKVIYPSSGTATCTIESDAAGYFKLLDNSATFISTQVAAGDLVTLAAKDYVVDSVLSENRLRLLGTQPVATTYAIHRKLTRDQQVTDLNAVVTSLSHARCTMIWPDKCVVAGVPGTQPGYYIAAAVGGMIVGLPPHQGFTFIGIAGISRTLNSNTWFYDSHLTQLSNHGWFVVVQDTPSSAPYCIHELTTDADALETGELMVVKNFDYVSMAFRDAMTGFLGVYNVTKDTMDFLRAALDGVTARLQARQFPKIGAPLISASVDSLAPLPTSPDQVDAYLSVKIPRPLNRVGLHLKA